MIDRLHIQQIICIQTVKAIAGTNGQLLTFVQVLERPMQTVRQKCGLDRLDEVIRSLYAVSLYGILNHARDEYQNNGAVPPSDFLSTGHTIHFGHLNVEEDDIIVTRRKSMKKRLSVIIYGYAR